MIKLGMRILKLKILLYSELIGLLEDVVLLYTYIAAHLNSVCVTLLIPPVNFECLFVHIFFHDNKQLTIGCFYRPPSAPVDSTKCILSTINSLGWHTELIILGKFNCNWLDRASSNDKHYFSSINLYSDINSHFVT